MVQGSHSPAPKPDASTVCFNCRVDTTPLWRRDAAGNIICNACGLYYKLHNVARPISMKRTVIKRRRRRQTTNMGMPGPAKPRAARRGPLPPSRNSPLQASAGRSSSMPLESATSSPVLRTSSDGGESSWTASPVLTFERPACGGLESLMRAAELSMPESSRSSNKQRAAQESLLDSLAMVATAEISLSKRRALDIHYNGFARLPLPQPDHHEALRQECERLHMIDSIRSAAVPP
ncbi:GATA type transcriptional activator of nitrogen-regulated proteins [Coemansia sp. RSA 552]|nr:GATA type transcriptional activator of nitrogen-regulated proteins [Coemansia sp. RSA 552]